MGTFFRNYRNSLLFLPVLAIILFAGGDVQAQKRKTPIGQLATLEGEARLVGSTGNVGLRAGDPVYKNNTIETGPESRAIILFVDDTEIHLGENASLTINEYVYDPFPGIQNVSFTQPKPNKAEFSVLKGAFEYVSGLLADPYDADVDIETVHGSIGIRGTIVWGGRLEDEVYSVFVSDGSVEFDTGSDNVIIPSGNGIIIDSLQEDLPDPSAWSLENLTNAIRQVRFNREQRIIQAIREARRENSTLRRQFWAATYPDRPVPWRSNDDDSFFTPEFLDQMRRHNERMKIHDGRIQDWQRSK